MILQLQQQLTSRNDADTTEFEQVEKPEFNIYSDDTASSSNESDDNGLDTPPFFKKRH